MKFLTSLTVALVLLVVPTARAADQFIPQRQPIICRDTSKIYAYYQPSVDSTHANIGWYCTDTIPVTYNGSNLTATAAELNKLHGVTAGTTSASLALVVDANKHLDQLRLSNSGLWFGTSGSETQMTATAAELNKNAGVTGGTNTASKTHVSDASKALDILRATTELGIGGTGVAGAASVQTWSTKAVTAFSDTTAKDVFTVTVPNAAHAAVIEVDCLGVLGAGGAIGAGEATRISKYQVVLARTAGVATVATVSSAIGGAEAHVLGGDAITSVVVTVSAMTGTVSATQTFTIKVAITRSGAGATNHTGVFTAKILNQNATGVTIS